MLRSSRSDRKAAIPHESCTGNKVGRGAGQKRRYAGQVFSRAPAIMTLSRVRVADDLIFNAVWVEKIETAARFIVGVAEGPETSSDHACFGGVKIVNFDANMVQRSAFGKSFSDFRSIASGVEGHVVIVRSDMDCMTTILCRAAPTDVPIEQSFHQIRRALGVGNGDIHVLNAR
jgi:hypothetical protein